jgi:putative DNA primase/helicase
MTTPTHDELRNIWYRDNPQTLYGLGDFRRYLDGLWKAVDPVVIKKEIMKVLEDMKPYGTRPTAGTLASVLELVKVRVSVDDNKIFDSHPEYLVCKNGALHLTTRILEPHDPKLYAISGVAYDYDPQFYPGYWMMFIDDLKKAIGADTVDFLQEFAGYTLSTRTDHEIAVWFYGKPGSGKSTFLTGLETMLGDRAGLLGLADVERNRFSLAILPGKTLMISTEQPGDYITTAHILNAIISGEPITVDRKFKDAIVVVPYCKLAWAMNDLPRVPDPNSGLFRRVKIVNFPQIPESLRNPTLKEAIKTEGAGILNWALEGWDRLEARGHFEIPPGVKTATENFKTLNDIPKVFIEECCEVDQTNPNLTTQSSILYNKYRDWCIETGHKPQSSTSIAEDWRRLGGDDYSANGRKFWRYIRVK